MLDSFVAQLIQAVLVFAGVLALVYVASRYFGRYWQSAGQASNLQLLGGLQVGPRSRVVLLRALDQLYVLGVTEKRVTLIDSLGDEALDNLVQLNPGPEPTGFISQLRQQITRRNREGGEP